MLRAVPGKGYIWVCVQDYKPGHESCGYFEWGKFDEFGEPPWSAEFIPDTQEGGETLDEIGRGSAEEVGRHEEQEEEVETEQQQEPPQEYEQREWSDETVGGSERDLGEDWDDGEDAEIAEELQEWRNGLR